MRCNLKNGISAACLLAALAVVWLWAGDKSRSGNGVSAPDYLGKGNSGAVLQELLPAADRFEKDLKEKILQIFTGQGSPVEVEKVSWEPEELTERMWEQMEQWQEVYMTPRRYIGYIEMLGESCGEAEEGFLREYATIQHKQFQDTFLVTDLGVYKIKSWGEQDTWRSSMRELLCSVPEWQITDKEAQQYVHEIDFAVEYKREPPYPIQLNLWYQGIEFPFWGEGRRLLEYESECKDGERLRFRHVQMQNGQETEWRIRVAEALPLCDTYRELREYLQKLHPDLWYCVFYTQSEEQYDAEPLVALMTDEAEYGYFCQNGQWYQVCVRALWDKDYRENRYSGNISDMGDYLDNRVNECYHYSVTEQGDVAEKDFLRCSYYYERESGPGQSLSFDCKRAEIEKGEFFDNVTYEIAVSVPGSGEPFQILEVYSSYDWFPFSFEDFNADGYEDLHVEYYYGANGGSASHYIWLPSRGEFVRGPEELEAYSSYSVDLEKRQLYIHMHDSAMEGTEYLYQWSGEADYELLRFYDYQYVYNDDWDLIGVNERISTFESGEEKVLSDYIYPMEESMEDGLYEMFLLDFVWEQELTLTEQEQGCILRYAQMELDDGEDGQTEKRYLDFLYLFRDDTYLICRLRGQEAPAAYADITWKEKTRQLAVRYENGMVRYYQWDGAEFNPEKENYTDEH